MTAERLSSQVREAPAAGTSSLSHLLVLSSSALPGALSLLACWQALTRSTRRSRPRRSSTQRLRIGTTTSTRSLLQRARSCASTSRCCTRQGGSPPGGTGCWLSRAGRPATTSPVSCAPYHTHPSLRLRLAGCCADHAGFEPDPALLERVTPDVAALLSGSQRWGVHRHSGPHGHPMASQLGDRPGPRL